MKKMIWIAFAAIVYISSLSSPTRLRGTFRKMKISKLKKRYAGTRLFDQVH